MTNLKERNAKYIMHRVAEGVEKALGCTILAQLPEVEVVSDCPKGKHGYYIDGINKIYIDKSTIELGVFFRDECLCHELIHWLGISSERIAHHLDSKSLAYMPPPPK